MVKALILGLLAATMCGFACAAPTSAAPSSPEPPQQSPLDDSATRSERSTNLWHVTGAARKIQMFIKNRHLQILVDGTVNGTTDDSSPYTILQRTTVGIGQMKIQGIATCQYLCMDSCGLLYGSREFGDECIFNETIEQHHYNTYSSTKYSTEKKTFYLALNRKGQPRKVLRAPKQLGRLSSYTRVLTRTVAPERAEELIQVRHHGHLCISPEVTGRLNATTADKSFDVPRCRKRKKRKKKKRKCPADVEPDSELCLKRHNIAHHRKLHQGKLVKKCDNEDSDECQRDINKIKLHKTNNHNNNNNNNNNNNPSEKPLNPKKKRPKKQNRKKLFVTTTDSTLLEYTTPDEDYGVDSTTHWDWDDSTALPDVSMSMAGVPTPLPD